MRQNVAQVRHVVFDAHDLRLTQRLAQRDHRGRPVGAVGDDLRHHRVVVDGNFGAGLDPGVHADGVRPDDAVQPARRGEEVAAHVLRVDPRLDGVAPDGEVVLGEGQGFPTRDA